MSFIIYKDIAMIYEKKTGKEFKRTGTDPWTGGWEPLI